VTSFLLKIDQVTSYAKKIIFRHAQLDQVVKMKVVCLVFALLVASAVGEVQLICPPASIGVRFKIIASMHEFITDLSE
jgi:hypothetical protein